MTPKKFKQWLDNNKQNNPAIQLIIKNLGNVNFDTIDLEVFANILNEQEILHRLTQNNPRGITLDLIRNLIDLGADINRLDRTGTSPLGYLAINRNNDILMEIVSIAEVDVNNRVNNNKDTLLHHMVRSGNYDTNVIDKLLRRGADPFILNILGQSPLELVINAIKNQKPNTQIDEVNEFDEGASTVLQRFVDRIKDKRNSPQDDMNFKHKFTQALMITKAVMGGQVRNIRCII